MKLYDDGISHVTLTEEPIPFERSSLAEFSALSAARFRSIYPDDDAGVGIKLLEWGRSYLPCLYSQPSSPLHVWIEKTYEESNSIRGSKANLIGPRGAAKSTVGTLTWVLRAAVEAREPYIWIVSDTRHQAVAHLENVKQELLDNPKLAADYPAACGRGPTWRSSAIVLPNGVMIEAFGTGVRMRGRRRREHRPTLIVCDDLQNDGHMESARQRMLSSRWFHGTLLKAGTRTTNVVNLATALHRDAVAMELCRTPGWSSRTFPAVVRWPDATPLWDQWEAIYCNLNNTEARTEARRFYDEHRPAMDAGAELLWPEVDDLYALMSMRVESGRTAFEREKQGVPINPELCEFPEEYFTHDTFWYDVRPSDCVVQTMALDPSKGNDSRHGDYSAIVLLAIDRAGTMYVEADLARRPLPQITADAWAWYSRERIDAFGVETNQFQEFFRHELMRTAQQHGWHGFVPWTMENRVPKNVRIRRLSPYLASRRMRFRSHSPGTKLLVNQLRDFPCGDHDDGPDALEMAVRLVDALRQPKGPTPEEELRRAIMYLRTS